MPRSRGLQQAYDLRNANHSIAQLLAADSSVPLKDRALALATATRAWAEADDHVRIHRGKPLPGSLRPDGKAKPRRQRQGAGSAIVLPVQPDAAPSDPTAPQPAHTVQAEPQHDTSSPSPSAPGDTPVTPVTPEPAP